MSRWWPERLLPTRLRVGLAPAQLLLVRHARGFKSRQVSREMLPLTQEAGALPWQAPLAALRGVLAKETRGTRVEVVLSQRFTRHALLPWSGELRGAAEWLAFAQHRFRVTHGAAAAEWDICIAREAAGAPRLACAIDRALLAALRETCAAAKVRLASVQPFLASAYNRARDGLKEEDLWFAIVEEGRMTLGLLRKKHWTLLRTRNLAGDTSIEDLVEREAALAGISAKGKIVYVGAPLPARNLPSPGRIQDRTLRAGDPLDLRAFAMVLA